MRHGRIAIRVAALAAICCAAGVCQKKSPEDEAFALHDWFVYRDLIRAKAAATDFERGVVACMFNDPAACERYLKSALRSGSQQEQLEAHLALGGLYFAFGRSRMALPHYEAADRLLGVQGDGDVATLLRAYVQGPDMFVVARRAGSVPSDGQDGHLYVPVTINGVPGIYGLDTGAATSAISESEAKRVGIPVVSIRPIEDATYTGHVSLQKVGVAERLDVGGVQLRNVPFTVYKDAELEGVIPARGGILGVQVLLACETVRWNVGGALEIGRSSARRGGRNPNLCLDGYSPRLRVDVAGHSLAFGLDTGSTDSYLSDRFADLFAEMVQKSGREEKWTVEGVGERDAQFPVTILPQVDLKLGSASLSMRPARIVRHREGYGYGLIGLDILAHSRAVTLDFRTMVLTVE